MTSVFVAGCSSTVPRLVSIGTTSWNASVAARWRSVNACRTSSPSLRIICADPGAASRALQRRIRTVRRTEDIGLNRDSGITGEEDLPGGPGSAAEALVEALIEDHHHREILVAHLVDAAPRQIDPPFEDRRLAGLPGRRRRELQDLGRRGALAEPRIVG